MTHRYPRFEDLGCAPEYTLIGANAMHNLLTRGAPAHERATLAAPRQPRGTKYVGVSKRAWGYAANYKTSAGKWKIGTVFATPEEAAWDRARILGRDYLETRS